MPRCCDGVLYAIDATSLPIRDSCSTLRRDIFHPVHASMAEKKAPKMLRQAERKKKKKHA